MPEAITAVAGPELDAAVAEHVMGWGVQRLHAGSTYVLENSFPHLVTWEGEPHNSLWMSGDNLFSEEWHPSTDIAAAWQVVNHMRDRGRFCTLRVGLASVAASINDGPWWYADTAPLAICRAALHAKGVEFSW